MFRGIRRQLTLFTNPEDSQEIENIRKQFNPKQYYLIDSHVTLCREDEIENSAIVLKDLLQIDMPAIAIQFGQIERFANGAGVLLPASGRNEQFHQLRLKILTGSGTPVRQHEPHITLMHPRNSFCTDETFKSIQKANFPTILVFKEISLIEQVGGGRWQVLETYALKTGTQ